MTGKRPNMNDRFSGNSEPIPMVPIKVRPTLKGRRPDPDAVTEVQALLGDESRRRDLLIEHLPPLPGGSRDEVPGRGRSS